MLCILLCPLPSAELHSAAPRGAQRQSWLRLRSQVVNQTHTKAISGIMSCNPHGVGVKNMPNGSAEGGMHARSSSQPQLHHDMDGHTVDSGTWGSNSWDAPERRSSASVNLDSPGNGGGGGGARAGSAGTSRLGHSASASGAAFAGFEGPQLCI